MLWCSDLALKMGTYLALGNCMEPEKDFMGYDLLPNSIAALTQLTKLQLEDSLPSSSVKQLSALCCLKELSLVIEDSEDENVGLPLHSTLLTRLRLHCSYAEVSRT